MPKTYIEEAGAPRDIKGVYIHHGGQFRDITETWTKRAGVWRQVFKRALKLSIDADVMNYDLFTAAGSPTEKIEIVLTIGLNVEVGSAAANLKALYCSTDLPAGSLLKIINKGTPYGAGGAGGSSNGNSSSFIDYATAGGIAISLGCDTVIDNTSGYIFGGGGGGGQAVINYGEIYNQHVFAGGGGAGSTPGAGGYVTFDSAASYASAGTTAAGGNGRIFYNYPGFSFGSSSITKGGGPGAAGLTHSSASRVRAGGDAGRAVERNGYALTIIGGENATQIKGAYD